MVMVQSDSKIMADVNVGSPITHNPSVTERVAQLKSKAQQQIGKNRKKKKEFKEWFPKYG